LSKNANLYSVSWLKSDPKKILPNPLEYFKYSIDPGFFDWEKAKKGVAIKSINAALFDLCKLCKKRFIKFNLCLKELKR